MSAPVWLSIVVMVRVPVYVPGVSVPGVTFTLVELAEASETVPSDVADSHAPPAADAVQFSVFAQAPLAVICIVCGVSEADCPAMPEKVRARGEAIIAHGD